MQMRWTTASLSVISMLSMALLITQAPAKEITLPSVDGKLAAVISVADEAQLTLSVVKDGATVIESSPLGITVDGQDLGSGVTLGDPTDHRIAQRYAWRGVKSAAVNNCMAYQLPIAHEATGQQWTLEVRAFDDGIGYRYRVPGQERRSVIGEGSSWRLTAGSVVWCQTNTSNYEGTYEQHRADDIPLKSDRGRPFLLGPPVTVQLPEGGFALITEAGLYRYSGMVLRPTGSRRLRAVFPDDPQGWELNGEIVTPWRATIVTSSLDALVNSVVISNLCEPPNPNLFPQGVNTEWIQPGKGLITWAVFGNDGAQWQRQKWFVDMCAAMHCEYLLVDAGWRSERWGWLKDGGDVWQRLAELCAYAATKKVGIFVWHAYPEGRDDGPGLTSREDRKTLFRKCQDAGVRGVKIDFFDSERKEIIDVYEDILRMTAQHQLMVNFHGAHKPTGEVRTWPHEITREGLREQEYVLWDQLPLTHYGALPFTRMIAGHGDFLPTYVRPKYLKNTTAIFQLATGIVFNSPFICWPDHPEAYLESPLLSMIRTMPAVWDETRVLPGSAIGKFVAFARRSGTDWYVAILNCANTETSYPLKLTFLGAGDYVANLYQDRDGPAPALRIDAGTRMQKGQVVQIRLRSGGGFVGQFSRQSTYTE